MMRFGKGDERGKGGSGDARKARNRMPQPKPEDHWTSKGVLNTVVFRFKEVSRRDPDVRGNAISALYGLGEDALPVFADILNDREIARRVAKRILSSNVDTSRNGDRDGAEEFDPDVIERKITSIRSASALFLGKIASQLDPTAKEGVAKALIPSLKDPSQDVRYYSVSAFRRLGEAAHVAINQLIAVAGDKGERLIVRQSAIESIRAMGIVAKSSINTFIGMVKDPSEVRCVRRAAIEALGELGKYSEGRGQNADICDTLLDRIGDDETELSNEAINAFVSLDGMYTKEIVKLVMDPGKGSKARINAVWALVGICGKEAQTIDLRERAKTIGLIVPHLVLLTGKDKDPASKADPDQNLLSTINEALKCINKQMY